MKETGKLDQNSDVREHKCSKNYGSNETSKNMEGRAAVQIALQLTTGGCYLGRLVIDDDTTTLVHLRPTANKGDLPDWMPAPIKLADHNH